jgi:hypothetical protein
VYNEARSGRPSDIAGDLKYKIDAQVRENSRLTTDELHEVFPEEIRRYSSHYSIRLRTHPNHLAVNLLRLPDNKRLRRFLVTDLPDRF